MKIALIALGIISTITFFLYGIDKLKAKLGAWRIPERVLLGFAFFGGGIGALLGINLFRHKTRHWYFWAVAILGVALQVAILGFVLFKL